MKLLYVSQFYQPENVASAFRATEHSRLWTQAGHNITVLSGWPNFPTGKIFDGYDVVMLGEECINGVRLLRSKLVCKPNTSFVNRIENGLSYLWYGWRNLHKNKQVIGTDYDLVFATSGTVFAGLLGQVAARKLKKPLVIEFRDITYSQLLATGAGSEKSLKYKVLRAMELGMAKQARMVVVLTHGFKDILSKDGINPDKIIVVPNGADLVDLEFQRDEGLRVGYFGAMGLSQVLPETIEALSLLAKGAGASAADGAADTPAADAAAAGTAAALTADALNVPSFEYLLVGEGAARDQVEAEAARPDREFIRLLHGMPKDELEAYYATIDMSVVSLRRSEAFSATIPSKIFQSWARGIPVLFFGPEGEAARMVRDNNFGITLTGTDEENAQTLGAFFSRPDWKHELENMGERAKVFIQQNYTREHLASVLIKELERVATGTPDATSVPGVAGVPDAAGSAGANAQA